MAERVYLVPWPRVTDPDLIIDFHGQDIEPGDGGPLNLLPPVSRTMGGVASGWLTK